MGAQLVFPTLCSQVSGVALLCWFFKAALARIFHEDRQYEHTLGYPGPVTAPSQMVWDLYVIGNMFSYVATGQKSIDEAMKWAEKEITGIYAGKQN